MTALLPSSSTAPSNQVDSSSGEGEILQTQVTQQQPTTTERNTTGTQTSSSEERVVGQQHQRVEEGEARRGEGSLPHHSNSSSFPPSSSSSSTSPSSSSSSSNNSQRVVVSANNSRNNDDSPPSVSSQGNSPNVNPLCKGENCHQQHHLPFDRNSSSSFPLPFDHSNHIETHNPHPRIQCNPLAPFLGTSSDHDTDSELDLIDRCRLSTLTQPSSSPNPSLSSSSTIKEKEKNLIPCNQHSNHSPNQLEVGGRTPAGLTPSSPSRFFHHLPFPSQVSSSPSPFHHHPPHHQQKQIQIQQQYQQQQKYQQNQLPHPPKPPASPAFLTLREHHNHNLHQHSQHQNYQPLSPNITLRGEENHRNHHRKTFSSFTPLLLPPHPTSGSSSASVIGLPASSFRHRHNHHHRHHHHHCLDGEYDWEEKSFNHCLEKLSSKRTWMTNMDHHHPHHQSPYSVDRCGGIENPLASSVVGGGGGSIYGTSSGNHIRDWGTQQNHHDRWETNTAITVGTSLHSGSFEMDLNLIGKEDDKSHLTSSKFAKFMGISGHSFNLLCQMYSGFIVSAIIAGSAFLSPLLMILLSKGNPTGWSVDPRCGPECDGVLISVSFKYLLLLIASWLIFVRKPRATLPRVNSSRAALLILNLLLLVAYWAFFVQRSVDRKISDYELPFRELLYSYPIPMLDILLIIHYLAVVWTEVRQQRPEFYIKVIRSPDGVSKSYAIGDLTIQRAAVWVLEKYYTDFPIYNPILESVLTTKSGKKTSHRNGDETPTADLGTGGLKYYGDVDSGLSGTGHNSSSNSTPNQQQMIATPNGGFGGVGNPNVGIVTPQNVNNLINNNIRSPHLGNVSTTAVNGSPAGVSHLFRNSPALTSKKSHSVVGVETSSRRSHSSSRHSHHHHHGKSRGRSSSRERDHHKDHHNRRGDSRDRGDDRLHEESDFERRVKKRKIRLISAAEEAFTHVRLIGDPDVPGQQPPPQQGVISMDPRETAQAIFPSIAKPLQKFLRQTRQQHHHSLSSILDYLSVAMKYGLSAKAFLEAYFSQSPVLSDERERGKDIQSWGLVCDVLLSRGIEDGTYFMLRQGEVSLLVTVSKLPYFDLEEEVIDTKSNRYVFRMNSETSV